MDFIKEKIDITCGQLFSIANKKLCDIENVEYVKTDGYKSDNSFPVDGWKPFLKGGSVNGRDEHFWVKASFRTPPAKKNTSYYLKCTTGFEGQWDATNPQGLVYLNGEMVQGLDTNHTEVYLEPDTDYILHNYFYIGLIDATVPLNMALFELDEKSEQLFYDMKVAYDACILNHKNTDEYISVMSVLEQTANLIDFRAPRSAEYYNSIDLAIDFIDKELYQTLCTKNGKPIVSCIAHTHIDVEWQWDRAQTKEKIQRSFATASTFMKKYPEYKFMLSQPELYRYLKEEAPEKYQELKEYVKQGRWEPEGAMYVEADCNLISGESFIRQFLHGKKFFKDEFGVDCKILFLPDVFGYSAALPQILNKCGIRHFVTSKISWNETNTLPVDTFIWEGIDGSEIFTNFITNQKYSGIEPSRYTDYVGKLTPSEIKGTWNRFLQKEYSNHGLTTYGHGDGGGGPTKAMIETQRRLSKGLPGMPVTEIVPLLEHLDKKREEFDEGCRKTKRIPKWVGELYLEFHRGTYTSVAKNKRYNRKAEFALQKAETLSYIGMLNNEEYDAKGLHDNWTKVLHNQFHDIIPGSSIKEVYDGTDKDYAQISEYTDSVIDSKLNFIANNISSEDGILIYNPTGFARKGIVNLEGKTVEISEEIPAFGWKNLKKIETNNKVNICNLTAENNFYKLILDESGRITELYDKTVGRNVLKEKSFGNEFQAFEDYPRRYDNWEITDYYKEKMWVLDSKVDITTILDGSRSGFKVKRCYMNSEIIQKIWLYSENRRIDFETEIDWHEHHQILKVAFPLDIHTNKAIYETQFGHIERPTHQNTSWDKAKFEVCGHKWVVLEEKGYGVALLNDCKYGFNTEGSTLKLTILKCGTFPNPEADQGKHIFTYSLLPYEGNFCDAGIINEAYALNQPLDAMNIIANSGNLPNQYSLVSCNKSNVIIETVKKAEKDNSMIVRMYDAFNCRTTAEITVADGFEKVYLCDMLENEIEELDFQNNKVTINVYNFEIVTLKFQKSC